MKYRIRHVTEYRYADPVSQCYNLAHLTPRTTPRQKCVWNEIHIDPPTAMRSRRTDYYGNVTCHFEIQQPHDKLVITATSEVETAAQNSAPHLDIGITCGEALQLLAARQSQEIVLANEFLQDSPMIRASAALRDYAQPSFADNRSLLSATLDLTQRIYREFTYCQESTTIATPLHEVLETRRGVCQDFAHLQIGCLRAMGFPAKYVSGYIETLPPPGKEKLVGSDASHAWISVYCPSEGWVEFDPTNNCVAGEQHIITAWGRDYMDVTPLKGIIFGGGENPVLSVSVDVARL